MAELCTAMLSNWKIEDNYGRHRLVGTIAGEDLKGRFKHGEIVYTSPLKRINFDTMMAVTMSGSIYKLMEC
jgi:hypothetical protein